MVTSIYIISYVSSVCRLISHIVRDCTTILQNCQSNKTVLYVLWLLWCDLFVIANRFLGLYSMIYASYVDIYGRFFFDFFPIFTQFIHLAFCFLTLFSYLFISIFLLFNSLSIYWAHQTLIYFISFLLSFSFVIVCSTLRWYHKIGIKFVVNSTFSVWKVKIRRAYAYGSLLNEHTSKKMLQLFNWYER